MYVYDIFMSNVTISLPTVVYVFSILWEDRPTLCGCGIRRERKRDVRGVRPNLQGKWFL